MTHATLNITFNGISGDLPTPIDGDLSNEDVKRIALEVVTGGGIPGMLFPEAPADAFENYVVDRFHTPEGSPRLYLRPKVPFGADNPLVGRTITAIRPMTRAEADLEGWDFGRHGGPPVLEFDDGSKAYPSRDHEGNGPGALFGILANGQQIMVI